MRTKENAGILDRDSVNYLHLLDAWQARLGGVAVPEGPGKVRYKPNGNAAQYLPFPAIAGLKGSES